MIGSEGWNEVGLSLGIRRRKECGVVDRPRGHEENGRTSEARQPRQRAFFIFEDDTDCKRFVTSDLLPRWPGYLKPAEQRLRWRRVDQLPGELHIPENHIAGRVELENYSVSINGRPAAIGSVHPRIQSHAVPQLDVHLEDVVFDPPDHSRVQSFQGLAGGGAATYSARQYLTTFRNCPCSSLFFSWAGQ